MGSCWSRDYRSTYDPETASDAAGGYSHDPLFFVRNPITDDMITQQILQMVRMVGTISQSFGEHPAPLVNLHSIADTAEGWQRVMEALILCIPFHQPLGPSAITVIFDDCPLPAPRTVIKTLAKFGLCRTRALTSQSDVNKQYERNLLVVLGCMADKFAGSLSGRLLTHDIMEYLFTFLMQTQKPDLLLLSIVAVEKFAKTKDNRIQLQTYFSQQIEYSPFVPLERYNDSDDTQWRQVGFCARWILDNLFLVEGRPLSYTTVDMSGINAILDCKNITDFLKISPDGLGARCDAHTFESVRCTFQINTGCWYYEAEVLTSGVMQIGWATKDTKFNTHSGYGIGDDNYSLAYDGCRRLIWHQATPEQCKEVEAWNPGDIVGCLIDIAEQVAIFSLNGVRLPTCTSIFASASKGFYAAASFMCFQEARFNFGTQKFRFAPTDREFKDFNTYGVLTDDQKKVIPRWLHVERLQAMQSYYVDIEGLCAICFDNKPDTILSPCRHKGFCSDCALRLVECPMCRERVWHYTVLPL